MTDKIYSPKIEEIIKNISLQDAELKKIFQSCLRSLWDNSIIPLADGRVQVTSESPASTNLRESTRLMLPLSFICRDDAALQVLLHGVIDAQIQMILTDPYADQFNTSAIHTLSGETGSSADPVSRKFALDALVAPIQLIWSYWLSSEDDTIFEDTTLEGLKQIFDILRVEQNHQELSEFNPLEGLEENAPEIKTFSQPFGQTGMVWSAYRPSQDACFYPFNIPVQMAVSIALNNLVDIFRDIYSDQDTAEEIMDFQYHLNNGIDKYGVVEHPEYGLMYAYETDGLNNHVLMDEYTMPNLMGIPINGFCAEDDEIYLNTRSYILSRNNPNYVKGSVLSGIGRADGSKSYVSSESLLVQALTENDPIQFDQLLELIKKCHGKTYVMQEKLDPDDSSRLISGKSPIGNALFLELVLTKLAGLY